MVGVSRSVKCAPHEGDIRFTFGTHPSNEVIDHGLAPYYGMDSLVKEWGDRWKTDGKPTETVDFAGESWATCFDYDESGLDAWDSPDFQIQTVKEFRFYFVSASSPTYRGERADKDPRVKGGTITVRPRWPDLTSDGQPVSVPDYGGPYIDVQVQASNIPHEEYLNLVKRIMGAYGISSRYFDQPHPDSHINDLAYYVRLVRGESGPLYAPDGPIARAHTLIQGDRSGYRKHVEDNTKIPGYYVTATVEDEKASDLIRGYRLGKEIKHYYSKEPQAHEPSEAPFHPKLEVSYQTKRTEKTVRWSEVEETRRELEETVLNCLEWSGLSPDAQNDAFMTKDPYWTAENTTESRKLVQCPLPRIESEQEHRVMQLWGEMTSADRDVIELLLEDGGKVSPKEAAKETGYTYRTIRAVIERLEGLIRHAYSEMQLESKKVQQELLKRTRAAGKNFKQSVESTVMDLADATESRLTTRWSRLKRKYAISVIEPGDCRKLLEVGYEPSDEQEARNIIREIKTTYEQHVEANVFGVHVKMTLTDGSRRRYKNMDSAFQTSVERQQQERRQNEAAREDFDFEAWKEAGCPPDDEWDGG